jgi:threonine/homoserine/homoserine lactone efflux protein
MIYETLITFFLASLLLGLIPGPDNIFVLMQSLMHGRKSGLWVVLGLCTGLLVHTGLVALGVAVIFQTSSWAFNALKVFGGLYLIYLAIQAFKAGAANIEAQDGPSLSSRQLYVRGIVMNISNPKVAIFFLAFLPLFTLPGLGGLGWQLLILGGVFIIATLLVFSLVALTAGTLARGLINSPFAQSFLHKVAGIIFILLAIKLAFTSV